MKCSSLQAYAMHPARILGLEYMMKNADKDFHNELLATWDKERGQSLKYGLQWTDRSSRYTQAYDVWAVVTIGLLLYYC